MATIRNPIEWSAGQLGAASEHAASVGRAVQGTEADTGAAEPAVQRIGRDDLRRALGAGIDDFMACRSDVAFVGLIYALAGAVLVWTFFDYDLLPLLFPAVSGFALVGPVAAVGLYEMSRRRERGEEVGWMDAVGVLRSPSFGAILLLGLALFGVFILWMLAAWGIWSATLGPQPPDSVGEFARQVLFTGMGWLMVIVGCTVGFLFALAVLAASVVSFPLLLDREVGLRRAVTTSFRVTAENPQAVLSWGAIVAAGLVLGSLPLFLGLIVVMPVLGHATWHLYRAAVAWPAGARHDRTAGTG
ncbi:MAG TPA: DUF2189 domain-containing protein [Paracoccaceae bacterium]|nr:DUF2189 domain-containing protein [Paracoccaceae bacterium]